MVTTCINPVVSHPPPLEGDADPSQGRASDRVRKKLRNYAAFQGELCGKRRPIVRKIMCFFQVNLNLVFLLGGIRRRRKKTGFLTLADIYNMKNAFH